MKQFRISSENMWDEIHSEYGNSGGVYILKCLAGENKTAIPVSRMLENDMEGILYIGKANCFTERIAELKKSISPRYISNSHECGTRYRSNDLIQKKYPYEELYVELISADEPRELESKMLGNYERTFGELPPLNRVS